MGFRLLRILGSGVWGSGPCREGQGVSYDDTVDDINPAVCLRILNYGNYGIFLIMGKAGFIPSTVCGNIRIKLVDLCL